MKLALVSFSVLAMVVIGLVLPSPGIAQEAGQPCTAEFGQVKIIYTVQADDLSAGEPGDPTAFLSAATTTIGPEGQAVSRGVLAQRGGGWHDLLRPAPGGTRADCHGDILAELSILFERPRTGGEAVLVITPSTDTNRLHGPAEFRLVLDGRTVIEADGAILVVGALEHVGP